MSDGLKSAFVIQELPVVPSGWSVESDSAIYMMGVVQFSSNIGFFSGWGHPIHVGGDNFPEKTSVFKF